MAAPYAKIKEQDDSAYINSEYSVNVFLAMQTPCGPVGTREVINSKNFYKTYTPSNEYKSGYSTSFMNADAVFDVNSPINICRVVPEDALYGGAVVTIGNQKPSFSLQNGLASPEAYIFSETLDNKTNEEITVLCKADLAGSLGGTYFVLPQQEEFVYLKNNARAEQATITCNADVTGSLSGTYLILPGQANYVWFNVDDSGIDPKEASLTLLGKTGTEVNITANATAKDIASAMATEINKLAGKFTAEATEAVVTVKVVKAGVISHGNSGTTGFAYLTSVLGVNASEDVEVSGLEGYAATYEPDANASAIATAVNAAMANSKNFTCAIDNSNNALLNIKANKTGYMTDAYDVGTDFVITTKTQGSSQSGSEAMLFYTADPNALDISIKIYSNQDHPEKAPMIGTFLVETYKNGVLEAEIMCSRNEDAKDGNGNLLYVETAMLASAYVRCRDNTSVDATELPVSITTALKLGGGSAGSTVTTGDMIKATKDWANKDDFDITLMLAGGWNDPAYVRALDTIAKNRGDCCVINSIPYYIENTSEYLNNIVQYRKNQLNLNSSYTGTFSSNLQVYNADLNKNVYIPSDGHIAGAIINAANNYEIFYPILGFKRGILSNVLDVKRRYTYEEMSTLYDNQINPIRYVPGRGIVIWGQKTMQTQASSLDRLNARLLLCSIKPQLQEFLEDNIGELNTDATRDGLQLMLNNLFERIQGKQGIIAYEVAVDALDPTRPNFLSATVRLQITPAVEAVELTLQLTPAGVQFG